jgi:hypothetical protein
MRSAAQSVLHIPRYKLLNNVRIQQLQRLSLPERWASALSPPNASWFSRSAAAFIKPAARPSGACRAYAAARGEISETHPFRLDELERSPGAGPTHASRLACAS